MNEIGDLINEIVFLTHQEIDGVVYFIIQIFEYLVKVHLSGVCFLLI